MHRVIVLLLIDHIARETIHTIYARITEYHGVPWQQQSMPFTAMHARSQFLNSLALSLNDFLNGFFLLHISSVALLSQFRSRKFFNCLFFIAQCAVMLTGWPKS